MAESHDRSRTAILKAMIRSLQAEQRERVRAEQELRAANFWLERRTTQLQALAMALTEAEQRERRRLAQILHDHLQQLLVGARHKLEPLTAQGQNKVVTRTARQIDKLLQQCLDQSQLLTAELSPPVVYTVGLAAALKWLGGQMRTRHGLAVTVKADDKADPADKGLRMLLFQAVRELLFNVVKHARVDRARVAMCKTPTGQTQIEVRDTGAGFDQRQAETPTVSKGGFGLFSIRERLEFLGGHMEIESRPGKGTRAVIYVPPAQSAQEGERLQSRSTPPPHRNAAASHRTAKRRQ